MRGRGRGRGRSRRGRSERVDQQLGEEGGVLPRQRLELDGVEEDGPPKTRGTDLESDAVVRGHAAHGHLGEFVGDDRAGIRAAAATGTDTDTDTDTGTGTQRNTDRLLPTIFAWSTTIQRRRIR